MQRATRCGSFLVWWVLLTATSGHAQTAATNIATGLARPVFAGHAPGDTSRLFILEQGSGGIARIKSVNLANNAVSTYLTISGIQTGGERGLLGLAFHPDFANNGHIYVNVTASGQTQIRRYTATGDPLTSSTADPGSLRELLQFNQPYSNHNGGWLGFNPKSNDPYLYIATGDGGSGGDPQNNAQDITNNKLGKMLRIDVDRDDFPSSATANYGIPASNPFVGGTGDDEIWAYGLRNPYRSSFDRESGDLWIGDVGQNLREEIDFQPANSPGGENYGWRVLEGNHCYDDSQTGGNPTCLDPTLVDPIYEYNHTSGGNLGGYSVTGGYLYHGSVDRFGGQYFFADYITNNVWTIDPYAVNVQASVLNRNSLLSGGTGSLSSFGEDANGELYTVSLSGSVYKITTTARFSEWNGDAGVGTAGDGTSWSSAENWTRDGSEDSMVLAHDTVVFLPGSSQSNINLGGTQTVSAVDFQAGYQLSGGILRVLSGNVHVANSVVATMDGELRAESANRSVRKRGGGTLRVNGTVDQTVVLDGTLGGAGSIAYLTVHDGAKVSPGNSIGALHVTSAYVQRAGAELEIEIGPTMTPIVENDQLLVDGNADIEGELAVVSINGYEPVLLAGEIAQFEVVIAGSLRGTFDAVTYNGVELVPVDGGSQNENFISYAGDGLFQRVDYSSTTATFEQYQALPGDANGDGAVDTVDFDVWLVNRFTQGTNWLTADFNADGATDVSDFNIWNAHRGTTISAIPEPDSRMLVLGGALFLLTRVRRRKQRRIALPRVR